MYYLCGNGTFLFIYRVHSKFNIICSYRLKKIGIFVTIITKYCAKSEQAKTQVRYKKNESWFVNIKTSNCIHHEVKGPFWHFMKRNAKNHRTGMIAQQFHTPWRTDNIKVAVVERDLGSGRYGTTARIKRLKDINAKGRLKAINLVGVGNMTTYLRPRKGTKRVLTDRQRRH